MGICVSLTRMSKTLVWFRADLRTRDNHALFEAHRTAEELTAVFLISAEQWREHDWGAPRVEFVLRNLQVLSEDLRLLRIPMLIRTAPRFVNAPPVLPVTAACAAYARED